MLIKQIYDPAALLRPEVQDLLKAAIESGVLLAPYGWDACAPDMVEFVVSPEHFMLLGAEKGRFVCCALGYFGNSHLFPYPTIVLFYNRGSAAARKALASKLLDTIAERGYTSALALNGSGHADKAWLKALTPPGVSGEVVGSLVKLQVD